MSNNTRIIEIGINILFSLIMIVFGLNKFLGFIAVAPPTDTKAQQFLGTMFSTYLFVLVAAVEIVGGVLLLIPKMRFIGWLALLPILVNIVAFHLAHDFIGNGIWLLPTMLYLAISFFHKDKIQSLLNQTT